MFQNYAKHWRILLAVFLIGLFTITGQVLIYREVLYLSQGNELTLGIILCLYILLTALGSFLIGSILNKKNKLQFEIIMNWLLIIAALSVPLAIMGLTFARLLLVNTTTELIPIWSLFWYLLIIISPLCLSSGMLFPFITNILGKAKLTKSSFIIAYLLEVLGSGIGGLLIFFFVFPFLQPINISFLLGLFILSTIFLISHFDDETKMAMTIATIIFILFVVAALSSHPNAWLKKIQWQNLQYVEGTSSRYGYVEVIRNDTQYNIYENGTLLAMSDGVDVNRNILKIASLQNVSIQRALLLGGGLNGLIADIVVNEKILSCDYVESNPVILEFIGLYFNRLLNKNTDKNIIIYNTDDLVFMKNKQGKKYDLVILSRPAPNTLLNNRFYTVEYYKKVFDMLDDNGLFFFSVASSSYYLSTEHLQFLASIYKTLKQAFRSVTLLPGDECIFIASKNESFKLYTGETRNKDLHGYYNLLFRKALPIERKVLVNKLNDLQPIVKENKDFLPYGYIYNILQGVNYLITPFFYAIKKIHEFNLFYLTIFFALFGLILLLINTHHRNGTFYSLNAFVLGLTNMTLQMIIMLVFQITHGYLFFQLGILTAVFMLGLALGCFLALWFEERLTKYSEKMISINFTIMLFFILMMLLVFNTEIRPAVIFNIFSGFLGLLSGLTFIVIVNLKKLAVKETYFSLASIYGWELLGTSLGALLTPLFLGVLGVNNICIIILILNSLCLMSALLNRINCKISDV